MLLSMTSKGEEHVRIAKYSFYHKPQRRWRINFWEYQGKAVFAVATCRFHGCIPIVLAM